MSEPLVTQCPACRTRFKISRNQLDAANGAVRCGACLEVFAGADCLIDQSGQMQILPPEDKYGVRLAPSGLSSGKEEEPSFAAPAIYPPPATAPGRTELSGVEDIRETDLHDTEDLDDELFTDWYHGTEIIYGFADDESDEPMSGGNSESSADASESMNDLSMQSLNESIDAVSLAIVEAPAHSRRLRYYLTYGLLNLLLLCILGTQYLWFNKNQLAARENLRGYYVKVCQLLEPSIRCNLPDYVNLNQISTRKLIVRSHPAIRNALIIDAIILNSAAFEQPFPKLELKFTDLDFKTVASRRFEPNEYLGGELTGLKFIPASTEVRVSLEIVDPGNLAVSYELYAVHP